MSDLITSAVATLMAIPGHTPRTASAALVESINADLGTTYDTARLGQWRRAERPIPQPVQDWLLRMCVVHAIESCGGQAPVGDEERDLLAAMLCPPMRPPA